MSAIEKIKKDAARDAKRYSEAQLNYGKGAGTNRRILKAELEEKMKDDIYKRTFEAELARINQGDVIRKIKNKKSFEKAYDGAKKTVRAARRAEGFYYRNRYWIDEVLRSIFR